MSDDVFQRSHADFLKKVAQQVYIASIDKIVQKYLLFNRNSEKEFLETQSITGPVRGDIRNCIYGAATAFIRYFANTTNNMTEQEQKILLKYFLLASVTEEIANLLEPGLEIFDRGKVTQAAREIWQDEFDEDMEQLIFDAWEQFLKTFSFISRSSPHLREFLRASYEAGSFRALSNIEDVLQKMDTTIKIVENEEVAIKRSLDEYVEELKSYREWAIHFATKN